MKVLVNKTKAILAGFVLIFTGGFGIYYLIHSMYPAAPVFLAVALIFGYLFLKNISIITVTQEYIRLSVFGIERKRVNWADVKELGLIGENVFSKKEKKTGEKYIYFSPVAMTKDERFQMIVKWPPKDKLYMKYDSKTLEYTQSIWGKELKTYNVDDLFPTTND